jgi:hypothetical protein
MRLPRATSYFVDSTSFEIANISPLPYFSIKQYQSPCGGVPVVVAQKGERIPERIQMANFPNPFNPSTSLRFTIANSRFVELRVYDVLGQGVATLLEKNLNPGEYTIQWDASNFPSGIYFYRLIAGSQRQIGKMNYVK